MQPVKVLLLSISFVAFSFCNIIAQNNSYATSNSNQEKSSKFEGMPPMPFQAFDMEGKTHYLPEYKGKVVVIAFWAAGDEASRNQIISLNRLKRDFNSNNFEIISLAQEDKSELVSFLKKHQIEYPVIPNSSPLGDAGYGSDLGTSRIFVVDKKGVVQKVLVSDQEEEMETYNTLKPVIQSLIK